MSEADSFIEEVTEEVRRDRLYALFRRYGWIAALVVVLIVAGTAWREWQAARLETEAQARGDAILAALAETDPAARAEALAKVPAGPGNSAAVLAMLRAAALAEAGDHAGAAAIYAELASHPDAAWRDLAALRAALLADPDRPTAERIAALEGLAVPGAPYRPAALEQLALLRLEAGEREQAIADLTELASAADASDGQRQRAFQLLVALGVDPAQIGADAGADTNDG